MLKKIIIAFLMMPLVAFAAGGGMTNYKADYDLNNKESLQRGAKLFVNYCLSCHSAAYQRYNRMGEDLGLTDAQVKANLMFAGEKVGETNTDSQANAGSYCQTNKAGVPRGRRCHYARDQHGAVYSREALFELLW